MEQAIGGGKVEENVSDSPRRGDADKGNCVEGCRRGWAGERREEKVGQGRRGRWGSELRMRSNLKPTIWLSSSFGSRTDRSSIGCLSSGTGLQKRNPLFDVEWAWMSMYRSASKQGC